jgi:hypothetical protein
VTGEAKQSQTAFLDLFWSLWPRSAKQSFTFGNIVALEHGSQGSVAFKLAPIAKPLRGKIICDVLQVVEISTRCSVGLKAMCYPTTNQQPTGSHSTAQTTGASTLLGGVVLVVLAYPFSNRQSRAAATGFIAG